MLVLLWSSIFNLVYTATPTVWPRMKCDTDAVDIDESDTDKSYIDGSYTGETDTDEDGFLNLCITCHECWLCDECLDEYEGQGQSIRSKNICRGHNFMLLRPNGLGWFGESVPGHATYYRVTNMMKRTAYEFREISPAFNNFVTELRERVWIKITIHSRFPKVR